MVTKIEFSKKYSNYYKNTFAFVFYCLFLFENIGKQKVKYGNLSEMVDSNGKTYCAVTKDHSQTINDAIDATKSPKVTETKLKDVKVIQIKSWEKQAKTIDQYAIIIMPLLFTLISVIYWLSFVTLG